MILSTWSFSSRKTGPSITTLAVMAECGDCGQSSAYRRATSAISRAHSTLRRRSVPAQSAVPSVCSTRGNPTLGNHFGRGASSYPVPNPQTQPSQEVATQCKPSLPANSLGRTGRTILRPTPFIRDLSAQTLEGRFLQIIFRLVEENSCLRTNPRKRALDLTTREFGAGVRFDSRT